jgi:hypothetical protein
VTRRRQQHAIAGCNLSTMRTRWLGMGLAAAFVACGGVSSPTHVELSGRTPAEAGALVAQSFCTHESRCGHVSFTCSTGGGAGSTGGTPSPTACTATIAYLPYDDCHAQVSTDVTQLLTCAMPTPAQVDTLEQCFDALAARPCVTQAEADAMARAIEATGTTPPDDVPASCALITDPPPGCPAP